MQVTHGSQDTRGKRSRSLVPQFRIALLGVLLTALLCAPVAAQAPDSQIENLYILSFNAWGELQNPGERDLARQQLELNPDIERVIILSYGWANDGQASYATYRKLVDDMTAYATDGVDRSKVAVIAVGWDSAQSGLRSLFSDIIPLPGLGVALAWLPDQLLFPLTFWSKAAQADRIGFGGLRAALNDIFSIYEGDREHPELFLVGHSFGCRIVSGLIKEGMGGIEIGAPPFHSAEHVMGVALLQPALAIANVDVDAPYPIMATMSQHDHAVGFLYPVANVALNSLGFTLFEAMVQRQVLSRVEEGVLATTSAAERLATAPARAFGGSEAQETTRTRASTRARTEIEVSLANGRKRFKRTLAEVLALPLNVVFTVIVTPIDYVYIQARGLLTRPVSHVMDTLAQVPLVEIPVDGLSRLTRRDVPWGQRSKGFFTLGPIHEGLGRMVTPRMAGGGKIPIYSLEALSELESAPPGLFVVDATSIIHKAGLGIDLSRPMVNYTIGWLAPVGAHGDIRNAEVVGLLSWLANGTPVLLP